MFFLNQQQLTLNSTLISDARKGANRLVGVLGFALHLAAPRINKRFYLGRLDLARAKLLVVLLKTTASPTTATSTPATRCKGRLVAV